MACRGVERGKYPTPTATVGGTGGFYLLPPAIQPLPPAASTEWPLLLQPDTRGGGLRTTGQQYHIAQGK